MRHLTTEELLLHCDGALAPELAVHVQECPACGDSFVHLQAVLFEAEQALRASVPPEPVDHRTASCLRLERALYPPKTTPAFPLRWSVVYSVAAGLTIMVLSGYLSTQQPASDVEPQLAVVTQTPEPVQAGSLAAPVPNRPDEGFADGAQQPSGIAEVTIASPGVLPADSELPVPATMALAVPDQGGSQTEAELARFEFSAPAPQVNSQQLAWMEPPAVPASAPSVPVAAIPNLPLTTFRTLVEEIASPERVSDPVAFAKVIEGYWLLTQARVWEEDLHPVWTARGLRIEGTVEDDTVRHQVRAAVLRQAAEPLAFAVRVREDLPAAQQSAGRRPRVVHASYGGPAGGAVRRSLLGHFSDAARRSFVSPQPSALESELVRYVSDVFRSQSQLLSHAYALQRILDRVDSNLLASAGPNVSKRFRELVQFHLRALDEREEAIYDRLSEALPRRVWSHRGPDGGPSEDRTWQQESQGLLEDTLDLDSNLTALFGSSSLTVDASEPEASCGELLNRIRTSIRRLKNRTQAL